MSGRPLLVGVVLVLVAALALAGAAFAVARGSGGEAGPGGDAARPNVLVVVTDDARAETLQVMPKTRRWLAEAVPTAMAGKFLNRWSLRRPPPHSTATPRPTAATTTSCGRSTGPRAGSPPTRPPSSATRP